MRRRCGPTREVIESLIPTFALAALHVLGVKLLECLLDLEKPDESRSR